MIFSTQIFFVKIQNVPLLFTKKGFFLISGKSFVLFNSNFQIVFFPSQNGSNDICSYSNQFRCLTKKIRNQNIFVNVTQVDLRLA